MFRTRMGLFRVGGILISVDASWLIILVLLSWTLSNLFRNEVPDLTPAWYWGMGFVAAMAFFVCIVLHELGHALTAQKLGIPIRGITLFMFGGVAELDREPPSALKEFLMAIAGPLVTVAIVAVLGVVIYFGLQNTWDRAYLVVLTYLAWINLVVLIFNMVPAFPLDGGRVFRSFLWGVLGSLRRATYWASLVGQGFAWLLILFGVLNFINGNIFGGIWMGLIGLFLNSAAQGSYQQVLMRQALQGEPINRFMNQQPISVPPILNLRQWVEEVVYRFHHKTYPVTDHGVLEGVISTKILGKIPREEWEQHTIGEVMQRDLRGLSMHPDADALQALERMQRTGSSRLLVVDRAGNLLGLVSLKDLLRFLHLKLELEDTEDENDGAMPPSNYQRPEYRPDRSFETPTSQSKEP